MVMVDWLFLDMNAFFASAEQQLRPELRGLPVAVVPMLTDGTCCIAASYEARPYGVRTGTNVGEARRLCPGLRLVEGRHDRYVDLHHQIVAAVETVLPVEQVCSIDEMACRLDPRHRPLAEARRVAQEAKRAIAERVGPYLRCSVGLAPNRFLAKVASNLQKPDGLSSITREELPERLHALDLEDFPGIAGAMRRRLQSRGVRSVRQLCALSRETMVEVWGSVVGATWWSWLRGDECVVPPTTRRSVGHSHMLPPELRTDDGARGVMVRLLHKAAARLRKLGYVARRVDFYVRYCETRYDEAALPWRHTTALGRCQDTPTLLRALDDAWRRRPPGGRPLQAAVTLTKLEPAAALAAPLFVEDRRAVEATRTMDAVNAHCGAGALYFASMHGTRQAAPMRIAFTSIPDIDPSTDADIPLRTAARRR